ncbi:hypothetical protein RV16_GL002150 [Enterococcus saccharolyticus]|nr:hypothetical protein [Enterococcus saccharolyticus]OJG89608.1 hypothetical protein RV16_GL002150 [Enterococcus saccharolyticus]
MAIIIANAMLVEKQCKKILTAFISEDFFYPNKDKISFFISEGSTVGK